MVPDESLNQIPLREPTFFILLALSRQSKHGYAILKDVENLSAGRVQLSTGTLYGALARLLEQGLVRQASGDLDAGPASPEPRGRKVYALTRAGRRALHAELQRLQSLLAVARQELGPESA